MREITDDTILWFGKYHGKTIAEVRKTDRQYISWAINKGIFKMVKINIDIMFREVLDEVFKEILND